MSFLLGLSGVITTIFVVWGLIKLFPYAAGLVIGLPVVLYKSLKLAFTKGSTLYKWRVLVVADIIALLVIVLLVIWE